MLRPKSKSLSVLYRRMANAGSALIWSARFYLRLCVDDFEGGSFGHESWVVVHFGSASTSNVDLFFVEFHSWVLPLEVFNLSREVRLAVEAEFVCFHRRKAIICVDSVPSTSVCRHRQPAQAGNPAGRRSQRLFTKHLGLCRNSCSYGGIRGIHGQVNSMRKFPRPRCRLFPPLRALSRCRPRHLPGALPPWLIPNRSSAVSS